ncbi:MULTISPECIES: hypothetical protein [Lactobacillaceae]|uniref:hypothetical protein n=1 Tax=Lactobacillaceae TaxID=33958 RepID=UPI00145760A7|nr:hypothetical protein [Lactobacillus sp. HBUAS51381]NLR10075.1 hypothetical protein [Lactobacillus sp. HBUAS51381]
MLISEISLYDIVQLDDGRIGVIDEMDKTTGEIQLEQRQQDFTGDWPIMNSFVSHVDKVIKKAE